jgi:hypothetical protein
MKIIGLILGLISIWVWKMNDWRLRLGGMTLFLIAMAIIIKYSKKIN